jgi:type I restriction enzyme R subunit
MDVGFCTEFAEGDRLFLQQLKERACRGNRIIETALANPLDKFELGIRKVIEEIMIQRMSRNEDIVTRYMDDGAFRGVAYPILVKEIYEAIRADAGVRSQPAAP